MGIWRPDCNSSISKFHLNFLFFYMEQEEQAKEEEVRKKFLEKIENIKRTSLSIQRIPDKYKTKFMQIAQEEFSNDYGMTLREMIRTWEGIYVSPNEELVAKIDVLADEIAKLNQRISALENNPAEEKVLKAADGKIIKLGGRFK